MPRYPVRPPDMELSSAGGVAAVDRALALLEAFQDGEQSLSLREITDRTRLVPSTALRLIASLLHFGYLQRGDDGRYGFGPAVPRLYRRYTASFQLEQRVLPVLKRLAAQTRESASLHVRQGDHRLVLFRVSSPQPLSDQARAGDLLPLDKGSGGHVLMAWHGSEGALYEGIRRDGYMASAISDRSAELAGISAPVFDAQGLVGALTLTMPAQRYDAAHIEAVRNEARKLSEELGGHSGDGHGTGPGPSATTAPADRG